MAVKIRLQRHGRGKRPFYHIVATDSRNRRDGKYIERLGDYNPLTSPATIHLDVDKTVDWLMKGAEPTDTVHAIIKYKGAMYRKHLLRGVAKGALTQEAADTQFAAWIEAHANTILDHKRKLHKTKEDRMAQLLSDETKKKDAREALRKKALEAANATTEVVPTEESADAPTTEHTEVPAAEVVETPTAEVVESPAAEATEAPAAE